MKRNYYVVGNWFDGDKTGTISGSMEASATLTMDVITGISKEMAQKNGVAMVIITYIIPIEKEEDIDGNTASEK